MKHKRVSPLPEKPLHSPGQSLDLTMNEQIVEAAIWLMVPLVLIVLTLFDLLSRNSGTRFPPFILPLMTLVVGAYSIAQIMKNKSIIRNDKLGRDGERFVGQALEELRSRMSCEIIHDVVAERFNVDHVIVSEYGVFAVETKTYSKDSPTDFISYDGAELKVRGYKSTEEIKQARGEAQWISQQIDNLHGRFVWVQPIIVFPGWQIKRTPHIDPKLPWVLNLTELLSMISQRPKSYSATDVTELANRLKAIVHAADHDSNREVEKP